MVLYRLNLGGEHLTDINVPKRVRGINRVADYITRNQADRYAKAVSTRKRRRESSQNWYDSHIDAITEMLYDIRMKLRAKYAEE